MNHIVVPTGYMGSGSSAVTDLVSEFKEFSSKNGSFEYVFLHCPGGVFDLEDKLLIGNNALRSDEAFHTFYSTMCQLYNKRLWWVGNYKKAISSNFLNITRSYLDELVEFQLPTYWYMQENTNLRMFFQLCLKRIIHIVTLGKRCLKKPLLYSPMWLAIPEPKHFYKATQKYIAEIAAELGLEKNSIILDQLLLPHNLYRIDHYFDDSLRVIVVDRDPRDVFFLNKYVWPQQNTQVIYPTDVYDFCKYYKQIRESELDIKSDKILRIHFEDLIYQYDTTVSRLYAFLNVHPSSHVKKLSRFDPNKSIDNTQLFLSTEFREEASYIEKNLKSYLYTFPYERAPRNEYMF